MAKADNLLALLWLLRSRRRLTAAQIAAELGIAERTAYRYIDALCASGAPIASEGGPGGGYSLLESFREPPLFFDDEERRALLHASSLAEQAGYPFTGALARALEKIRRRMDPRQLRDLARHADALGVVPKAPAEKLAGAGPLAAILAVLENAAAESLLVEIDYVNLEGRSSRRRKVEPYGLVYWSNRWYLVAYCRLRRGLRLFRADRIAGISRRDEHFERPGGFSPAAWFVEHVRPRDPVGSSISVRIAGAPASVDHLSRNWILRSFVTERTPTGLVFVLERETALEHLPPILLGYGTSLRVIDPPEMKECLAAVAARVAAFHASLSRTSPEND